MPRRGPIKHLSGKGALYREGEDEPIGQVTYSIDHWQEYPEPGIAGMTDFSGKLTGLDEFFTLVGENLELIIDGGRRLALRVQADGKVISAKFLSDQDT